MKGCGASLKQKAMLLFPLPSPLLHSAPTPSGPGRLGKLQMDIGEDAGGDGEGDGRVDEDGQVREVV